MDVAVSGVETRWESKDTGQDVQIKFQSRRPLAPSGMYTICPCIVLLIPHI